MLTLLKNTFNLKKDDKVATDNKAQARTNMKLNKTYLIEIIPARAQI